MKFKLVEKINGGHDGVSSNDILNEETLLEKGWYGVNYTFDEGSGLVHDKVFIYAKDENQAKSIFDSAKDGFYTANKKEQTLNRKLVDIIKNLQNIQIGEIEGPISYNKIDKLSNVLSKRDRQLRIEAQNELKNNLDNIPKEYQYYKYLIHHIDEDEHNNNLSNMMLVGYNNKYGVKIAHAIHQLIHMSQNRPLQINNHSPLTHILDMSTNPPTILEVNITINKLV